MPIDEALQDIEHEKKQKEIPVVEWNDPSSLLPVDEMVLTYSKFNSFKNNYLKLSTQTIVDSKDFKKDYDDLKNYKEFFLSINCHLANVRNEIYRWKETFSDSIKPELTYSQGMGNVKMPKSMKDWIINYSCSQFEKINEKSKNIPKEKVNLDFIEHLCNTCNNNLSELNNEEGLIENVILGFGFWNNVDSLGKSFKNILYNNPTSYLDKIEVISDYAKEHPSFEYFLNNGKFNFKDPNAKKKRIFPGKRY